MMIAFASRAPPIVSSPPAVAVVNSSMFWRVPGPADRDEMVDTVSAYVTSATRVRAATTGIVACAPQVMRLISRASRCSREVDGRHHGGAERGGREVDAADAPRGQQPRVLGMRAGRGCVERQVDVVDQLEQPGQTVVGDGVAALARQPQTGRAGVDAGHADQLERGAALDLDHQVGADVARRR